MSKTTLFGAVINVGKCNCVNRQACDCLPTGTTTVAQKRTSVQICQGKATGEHRCQTLGGEPVTLHSTQMQMNVQQSAQVSRQHSCDHRFLSACTTTSCAVCCNKSEMRILNTLSVQKPALDTLMLAHCPGEGLSLAVDCHCLASSRR